MGSNGPVEPGAELVMAEAHGWEEHDMTPVTHAEVAQMFDAAAVSSWRKQQAQRFKTVPKPSRPMRVWNWVRRLFQ